ncbi:YkgJ family cysteine cluster protein [Phormidium sp. FACHB-592]|uniref:Uncharacterized protein n=1 Tax=Stenomitos frigidus AS-A4 TaxID=2933935 RepID=A0ABV0KRT0_9CYAN|nr:YkgJ family cysteine cluster protein [Phormidium sp. FACHB-592]MBD2078296.1 YkgJ family cysteine cluster protein [Phormidium sp. FACHB-592]
MPKLEALLQQSVEQMLSGVGYPDRDEQAGACRSDDSRPLACRAYGFVVARDHDQDCEPLETAVA